MKKNILVISDYYLPHWTGVPKVIRNIIKELSKHGLNFTVLTVRHNSNLREEEVIDNVKVVRCNPSIYFSRAIFSIHMTLKYLRMINGYDVVFIHTPSVHIFPIIMISKLLGKKTIVFHHGDLTLPSGVANRIIQGIYDLVMKLSLPFADKILCHTLDYAKHSRNIKNHLIKFEATIPPYSYSAKKIKSKKLDEIYRIKKEGKIVFGSAGRFVEEKGYDLLFKALPKILETTPNFHFIFAGQKTMGYEDYYSKLSKLIEQNKKHITLIGKLTEGELRTYYDLIDFVIIPSRTDCFNTVQVEACLGGKLSICSDIPGTRELVRNTGYGVLVNSKDTDDFAKKINEIITREKELKKNKTKLYKYLSNENNAKLLYEILVS